jgi:hypothetical protein
MYKEKYLKYKTKYLNLQKQIGSGKYDDLPIITDKKIINEATQIIETKIIPLAHEGIQKDTIQSIYEVLNDNVKQAIHEVLWEYSVNTPHPYFKVSKELLTLINTIDDEGLY